METDNETEFAVALIDPGWLVERFITLCALFRFPDVIYQSRRNYQLNLKWVQHQSSFFFSMILNSNYSGIHLLIYDFQTFD